MRDCRITKTHFYLFYEYVPGCQLTDKIGRNGLDKEQARKYFDQIVEGIGYCHSNFVVHRDIKVENIMIDTHDRVRIIDFGLANFFDQKTNLNTFCGSLQYSAPEIMRGDPYVGPEVDIWSLGVVLFAMLTGTLPFEDPRNPGAWDNVMNGRIKFPHNVDATARSLISKCLDPQPKRRITMNEIARHPYLKKTHFSDHYHPNGPRELPIQLDIKVVGEMTACLFQSEYSITQKLETEMKMGKENPNGTITVVNSPVVAVYNLVANTKKFQNGGGTQKARKVINLDAAKQVPALSSDTNSPAPSLHRNVNPQEIEKRSSNAELNSPVTKPQDSDTASIASARKPLRGSDSARPSKNVTPSMSPAGQPSATINRSIVEEQVVPTYTPKLQNRADSDSEHQETPSIPSTEKAANDPTIVGFENSGYDKETYHAKRASMYETYNKLHTLTSVNSQGTDAGNGLTRKEKKDLYRSKRASIYDDLFTKLEDGSATDESQPETEKQDANDTEFEQKENISNEDDTDPISNIIQQVTTLNSGDNSRMKASVRRNMTIHRGSNRKPNIKKTVHKRAPLSDLLNGENSQDESDPEENPISESPIMSKDPPKISELDFERGSSSPYQTLKSPFLKNQHLAMATTPCDRSQSNPVPEHSNSSLLNNTLRRINTDERTATSDNDVLHPKNYLESFLEGCKNKMTSPKTHPHPTYAPPSGRPASMYVGASPGLDGTLRSKKKVTFMDDHSSDLTPPSPLSSSRPNESPRAFLASPRLKSPRPTHSGTGSGNPIGVRQVSILDCLQAQSIQVSKMNVDAMCDQLLDILEHHGIEFEWSGRGFEFSCKLPSAKFASNFPHPHLNVNLELATVARVKSTALLMTSVEGAIIGGERAAPLTLEMTESVKKGLQKLFSKPHSPSSKFDF